MDWKSLRESLVGKKARSIVPSRVKLPILPLAVTKFSQKAEDPNASAQELGKIIECDSGLTCELLRTVNSSARGMSQKVTTAQQAIGMLGVRQCKIYLLTKAVERSMRGRESKLINIRSFWATNLERALLAKQIARLLKADPETAFAAGMLQDMLLPALTNDMLQDYLQFTKRQQAEVIDLHQFERETFGWDHSEAAAHVMFSWRFPDELICCTFLHHHGLRLLADKKLNRTTAAAAAVSALMPDALKQDADGMQQLIKLDARWPGFDLLAVAEKVDREYQETSPAGGENPFSFLRRCRKTLSAAK